jgi:hypothetical protein
VSDLSELFEQLADRPVLLATDTASANADLNNGTTIHHQACARLSKSRIKALPRTQVNRRWNGSPLQDNTLRNGLATEGD